MRKKIIRLLIALLILALVIVGVIQKQMNEQTKYNSTYVNGNIDGNLYNGGTFCEYEGTVYFSNPNDNGRLYSMDRNGNNLTKLCDDTASYINVDDNYVYYTRSNVNKDTAFSFLNLQTHSLCRLDKKTGAVLILESDPSIYACLVGNYVYYSHYDKETASTLYRIKIDGTERECIINEPIIAVAADSSMLYYSGTDKDSYVYSIDTQSGSQGKIKETNCYQPIISDGFMYYIDCDRNYCLAKMSLTTKEVTTLTADRVDCFNVYGSYVYYQRNAGENSALCRVKDDGFLSEFEIIRTGNYCNINITSSHVYFSMFGDESGTIFCTPTNSRIYVTNFSPNVIE